MEFEMVRDLGDQDLSKSWLPFIMYKRVSIKKYQTVLCFLNVENLG
jgi:hypothetical protein